MNALCEEISDNPDKSHVSNLRYQLTALSLPSPGFLSFLTSFLEGTMTHLPTEKTDYLRHQGNS